jgi:hypothetical protein
VEQTVWDYTDDVVTKCYLKTGKKTTPCAELFNRPDFYDKDGLCCIDEETRTKIPGTNRVESVDVPYWLSQNSWGTEWGDGGYVKFERTRAQTNGVCGIYNYVQYVEVEA